MGLTWWVGKEKGCLGGEAEVGGIWVAALGAVPEPADRHMILGRPSPACSSSCHSALRDALRLPVWKAQLRPPPPHWAGHSSHQPSSSQRPVTRPDTHHNAQGLERHQVPSRHAQDSRRSLIFPPWCPASSCQLLPAACPQTHEPPDRTDTQQPRDPVFHCRCLQVRCEGRGVVG